MKPARAAGALAAGALFGALASVPGATAAAQPAPSAAASPANAPDTKEMIEALMPSQTRSLRNLVVRQRAEAASAPAPVQAPVLLPVPLPAATPAAATATTVTAPAVPAPTVVAAVANPSLDAAPSLALAIQFEPNSSRVRPVSGPVLGTLVAAMQSPELKASRFIIEGHADGRGAADRNLRLSQERADEVRLYLVALGVHPSRLRAVGKGASAPVRPGDPAAAENRRVRVVTVE
jgi:outer membrane protein OmpA-like peptidoglycan-associated protein